MSYATGKFSYALCDYCGQRYQYNVLRKNWRDFLGYAKEVAGFTTDKAKGGGFQRPLSKDELER